MKVCIISDVLNPTIGGSARYTFELAKALQKKKCNVTVICANSSENKKVEGINKILISRFKGFIGLLLFNLGSIPFTEGNDIIHVQVSCGIGYGIKKKLKLAKAPMITTVQGIRSSYYTRLKSLRSSLNELIVHFLVDLQTIRFSEKIIAPTKKIKQWLINNGVPEEKIEVIYNGVNCSVFKPRKTKLREKYKDNKVIIWVGRIETMRNILNLIISVKYIKKRFRK